MNKPIVLVVHGMGTHEPGNTKKDIALGINEAAKNFGLAGFDLANEIEFFQFNYSIFLDDIRKNVAKQSSMTAKLAAIQGFGIGESIVDGLEKAFSEFGDDEMLYSHWMDVAFYGLTFYGEKIRVDLAKRLNDVFIEASRSNRKVHIIAHSLGTAVVHDTLAKLFRKDVDLTSQVPGLDIRKFKVESLWMAANVSRLLNLLNDIADPNKSIVHSGDGGCARNMYVIRNQFDPFTWVKRYKRRQGVRHIRVDTIRVLNTHDLKEYVAAPPVAATMLAQILDVELGTSQWNAGVAKHGETAVNKTAAELQEVFKDVLKEFDGNDPLKALISFFATATKFREKLKQLIDVRD